MFDKIGNLPLHPLVIHAAVVGIPLAVLLAFLFAFPKTRAWARWPLAIVVVGATAVTFVARQSGLALETDLGIKPGIARHADCEALPAWQPTAVHHDRFLRRRLLNVFLVSRGTAGSPAGGSSQPAIVRVVLPIALLIVAVVALVWVVRVGDLRGNCRVEPHLRLR